MVRWVAVRCAGRAPRQRCERNRRGARDLLLYEAVDVLARTASARTDHSVDALHGDCLGVRGTASQFSGTWSNAGRPDCVG